MYAMILFLCFLPLIIVFILMKFVLLVEESHKEYEYVRKEPSRERSFLENVYEDTEDSEDGY